MTISVVSVQKEKDKSFSLQYGNIIFDLILEKNKRIYTIKNVEGDIFDSYLENLDDIYVDKKKSYEKIVKGFFDNIQMMLYHNVLNKEDYNHPKYTLYKEQLKEAIHICSPMFGLGVYIMEYNFLYIISSKEKVYMVIENEITKEYFLFEYKYVEREFEAKYTSYSLFDLLNRITKYQEKDKLIQNLLLYFI